MKSALTLALLLFLFGCEERCVLRVSAAVSLSEVISEVAREFERSEGCSVVVNAAASSTLARQIESGAPADLFVSADLSQVERLRRVSAIDDNSVTPIASNQLVLVTRPDVPPATDALSFLGRQNVRRIAIGEPSTVPAGVYARRFLERSNAWHRLRQKLVPVQHVRAALRAVARGEADAAFVYATDTAGTQGVRVAFRIPPDPAEPIRYYAAVTNDGNRASAAAFLRFLNGASAQRVFAQRGFGSVK